MPYDGSVYHAAQDPVLGRLTQARSRLSERENWISGRYFEEDSYGYHYCILGALSADPAHDGCMEQDAIGQEATVWLAEQIAGARMSFRHASRIIYNFNDGYAALEHVSRSPAGLMFFACKRHVDGHKRVLDVLDKAIAVRAAQVQASVPAAGD